MKGTMNDSRYERNDRIQQLEIAIIELREQLDKMSCAKTCKKKEQLTLTDVGGSFSQNDMKNFAAKCMILGSNSKDIKELLKGFCDNDN